MRTVKDTKQVTIQITKEDLIDDKWLNLQLLSKKLGELEQASNAVYKSLRNRLYNSCQLDKYNLAMHAGFKCIDVTNPMKANASLELSFERC